MVRDVAVDLGTANLVVWARERGIVLNEPTIVAIQQPGGEVRAMGHQAYALIARNSDRLVAHRPMAGGAIIDFHAAVRMLELAFQQAGVTRFSRSRVLIGVPSGVTEVERRAVEGAAMRAGAGAVYLIEEPLAAAIGAGLPIQEPIGTMLLDVGGGTSQVAMMSLGGIVTCKPVRTGGFDMDVAIAEEVRQRYAITISERAAEEVKVAIGSAYPLIEEPQAEVRGRELATGLPRTVVLGAEEVRAAIDGCVSMICMAVIDALSNCPPELAQDVLSSGLWLVGGGAQLRGLDARIATEAKVPVHLAEHPLEAVARGAGQTVEDLDDLKHLLSRA